MSFIPSGTYFFAYGFQLETGEDSLNLLVNRLPGTKWHHFELHKRMGDEIVLLGLTTPREVEKLGQYDITWSPSPQLIPMPAENFSVLMIVPLNLLDKIVFEDLQLGAGEVSALKATLQPMPKKEED
jgi:hypothetical protein